MLIVLQWLLCAILFLLFSIGLRHLLLWTDRRTGARARLTYWRERRLNGKLAAYLSPPWLEKVFAHLMILTESLRVKMKPGTFVVVSLLLLLSGALAGALLFQRIKGVLLFGVMTGILPYVLLRLKLVNAQMRTRLNFLPAVEIFYQCYLLSGSGNVRHALQKTLEGNRLLYPIRPVFEQLQRNLSTNRDAERSLRIFSHSLGHIWGDYFVSILRVALQEGNDVSASLKELIHDMRKAQLTDQADRNRLLEIRIANFTPLLFLAAFLAINFHLNPDTAYQYYLADPQGRSLLLDAVVLIFASFVMGLHLSRKRI